MKTEQPIVTKGFQLCALLTVCGHAVSGLDNIPDGPYRESVVSGLSNLLELGGTLATDLLIFAEKHASDKESEK